MESQDKLILSLDFSESEVALDMAERLRDWFGMLRVGPALLLNAGVDIVERLRAEGHRVMLDLAMLDDPEVIAMATRTTSRLGLRLVTLQAQGGRDMLRAALSSLSDMTLIPGQELLGVVATTMSDAYADSCSDSEFAASALQHCQGLAATALDAGVYGVVLPRRALATVRKNLGPEPSFFCYFDENAKDASLSELLLAGANHIIIGDSVSRAIDPLAAMRAHYEEICEIGL